jgi:hypothetical protein
MQMRASANGRPEVVVTPPEIITGWRAACRLKGIKAATIQTIKRGKRATFNACLIVPGLERGKARFPERLFPPAKKERYEDRTTTCPLEKSFSGMRFSNFSHPRLRDRR